MFSASRNVEFHARSPLVELAFASERLLVLANAKGTVELQPMGIRLLEWPSRHRFAIGRCAFDSSRRGASNGAPRRSLRSSVEERRRLEALGAVQSRGDERDRVFLTTPPCSAHRETSNFMLAARLSDLLSLPKDFLSWPMHKARSSYSPWVFDF